MILLVVRQGVSGAGEINDMTDNLLSDNQVIMGTVFNAVKSRVIHEWTIWIFQWLLWKLLQELR